MSGSPAILENFSFKHALYFWKVICHFKHQVSIHNIKEGYHRASGLGFDTSEGSSDWLVVFSLSPPIPYLIHIITSPSLAGDLRAHIRVQVLHSHEAVLFPLSVLPLTYCEQYYWPASFSAECQRTCLFLWFLPDHTNISETVHTNRPWPYQRYIETWRQEEWISFLNQH